MRSTEAAAVAWPRSKALSVNLSKFQVCKAKNAKARIKTSCIFKELNL